MVYCAGKLIGNLNLCYILSWDVVRTLEELVNFPCVLPTSRVGYHAGKPIESVVYRLNTFHSIKLVLNKNKIIKYSSIPSILSVWSLMLSSFLSFNGSL